MWTGLSVPWAWLRVCLWSSSCWGGGRKMGRKQFKQGALSFPTDQKLLPLGWAQGLWTLLVVATEMQPLAAQTDHFWCSFNMRFLTVNSPSRTWGRVVDKPSYHCISELKKQKPLEILTLWLLVLIWALNCRSWASCSLKPKATQSRKINESRLSILSLWRRWVGILLGADIFLVTACNEWAFPKEGTLFSW